MEVIIVIYINIGQKSLEDAAIYIDKVKKTLKFSNDNINQIFVPIRHGDSRIECINPQYLDKKEYQAKVSKIMFDATTKLDEFIDSERNKFNKKSKITKPEPPPTQMIREGTDPNKKLKTTKTLLPGLENKDIIISEPQLIKENSKTSSTDKKKKK